MTLLEILQWISGFIMILFLVYVAYSLKKEANDKPIEKSISKR